MLALLAAFVVATVPRVPHVPIASAEITGTVFLDANHNGVREPNERGIRGVVVSNQDTVVTTDATGAFRIPRGPNGIIFVSTPDGYKTSGNFWRTVADSAARADFPLAE